MIGSWLAILFSAALLALIIVTAMCSTSMIKIPAYKPNTMYRSLDDPSIVIKEYPPQYEWLNGESKDFIQYNEFGLPGVTIPNRVNVALCGSSFVMGQLEAPEIASSLLQRNLLRSGQQVAVYNLGDGNHGPYRSFQRTIFYDHKYNFDLVIYVNDGNWESTAAASISARFEGKGFRKLRTPALKKTIGLIRQLSRFLNLLSTASIGKFGVGFSRDPEIETIPGLPLPGYEKVLGLFRQKWGDRFTLVNISGDTNFNNTLEELCNDMGIGYHESILMERENLIGGYGHLNQTGNRKLASILHSVINQHHLSDKTLDNYYK